MPTPDEILTGLREISNAWRVVAALWHVYFAAIGVCLISGLRPSRRLTGMLLTLPLFSVSSLAWASGNPFNGSVFALIGGVLVAVAISFSNRAVEIAPVWARIPGALIFVFGWIYPHFLNAESFLPYLYSAPTGLIPCPTLSVVIALTLILGGLKSRLWSLVLSAAGLFYGVFGVARLGVNIDLILLVGALILAGTMFAGESVQRDAKQTL